MITCIIADDVERGAIRDAMVALESGAGMTWAQYVAAIADDADVHPETADAMIEIIIEEASERLRARRESIH